MRHTLIGLLWLALLLPAPLLAHGGHAHSDHGHSNQAGPSGHAHGGTEPSGSCADPAALPSLRCARSPTPAFDADGRLWLTWYAGGHIYLQHSDDRGRTFSEPVAVNRVPEPVDDQGEDRPQIAFGPEGEIYLLWTRKLDVPWTGHIRFSRSLDGGQTFSKPVNVNDDAAVIAHRFPTFRVNRRGEIFVAWIDKRDVEAARAAGTDYAGAALYYAVSRDRGAHFSASRKLADHSCECCRIAMELDARGLPVIFYRHVFPGQIRDHAIIRFSDPDTPLPLRRATHDDWEINGCPHQGPALARSGDALHLAWFTAGPKRQGLFYARREDDKTGTPMSFGRAGAEHAAVAALGETVVLAWKAFADDRTHLYVRRSTDGGQSWEPAAAIAGTAGASDHPLLVSDGRQIYLSWQTAAEGYRLWPLPAERGGTQ